MSAVKHGYIFPVIKFFLEIDQSISDRICCFLYIFFRMAETDITMVIGLKKDPFSDQERVELFAFEGVSGF